MLLVDRVERKGYFFHPRDLISISDVMEELDLGPNGGLVFAMEYLVEHIEWLTEQVAPPVCLFPSPCLLIPPAHHQLADYGDDYLIFDCPGQIEL